MNVNKSLDDPENQGVRVFLLTLGVLALAFIISLFLAFVVVIIYAAGR